MPALQDNPEQLLESVNRRLAEMLPTEPLELTTGAAESMTDQLWVWGVLGGKDVGKSTLINALAGSDIVDCGGHPGEGTFMPAAYLAPSDLGSLQARLSHLGKLAVTFHADAPESMHSLVLVDLPDFDSVYHDHAEQVRRVASALDGIIWVTTPKKIGDLRAIREIQQILKDRTNFVYVVNKMDWLLGQTAGPPLEELARASNALSLQIAESDPDGRQARSFLVSARHRAADAILQAIARSRDLSDAERLVASGDGLGAAVKRLASDFEELKRALTTAPTCEAAASNKRANLAYQVRTEAVRLLEHHQPDSVLARLNRVIDDEVIDEVAGRCFPHVYCQRLLGQINGDRRLFAEWSTQLFNRRISRWPLLGLIAWPVALVGWLLGGLRSVLPAAVPAEHDDPFRFDGLSLEERVEGFVAGIQAELAGVSRRVDIEMPETRDLVRMFRTDVTALADQQREAVIAPMLNRKPAVIGRLVRWLIPVGVLLWFPLVQPLTAGLLELWNDGLRPSLELALTVVNALSAHNVLVGLGVAILILAALAAAVYSRAVRDAFSAVDRLRSAEPELASEPLTAALTHTVRRPLETVRDKLADLVDTLKRFAE